MCSILQNEIKLYIKESNSIAFFKNLICEDVPSVNIDPVQSHDAAICDSNKSKDPYKIQIACPLQL